MLPPGVPVALDVGRIIGFLHVVLVHLLLDSLSERELVPLLRVLLEHVGGLLLGLRQLGRVP